MFERFTERARQVVVLAQDEARNFEHDYIGTEHVLVGLLREEEGLAARVLSDLGVTIDGVRATMANGNQPTTGQIPFTPRAQHVLELALREALSLGHNYIGTEHVLLGLIREPNGPSATILGRHGITPEVVRAGVIAKLSGKLATPRVQVERVVPEPAEDTIHVALPGGRVIVLSLGDAAALRDALIVAVGPKESAGG